MVTSQGSLCGKCEEVLGDALVAKYSAQIASRDI